MERRQSRGPRPAAGAPGELRGFSRREFLGWVGAAGGALLLRGAPVWGEEKTPDAKADGKPALSFALVSDTHLGKGKGEERLWEQAVEEINKSGAEFTLICGDLVNAGEKPENEAQYAKWAEIAKKLKGKWVAVPGNHDPDATFAKLVQEKTDTVFDHKGLRFVCFRDAEPNPGHMGIVTAEQIKWIDQQIRAAPGKGKSVVLVAHVIHHANKHPDVGWCLKDGRKEFGELLQAHKDRLYAMIAGHFHCGLRGWSDTFGIHEIVLPSVAWNRERKGLAEQGGGFCLDELRSGWVLAEVGKDGWVLKYKPLGAEAKSSKTLAPGPVLQPKRE